VIACVREAVDMNQDIKICGYLHNWWVENSSVVSCLKSKGREKEKAEKDTKSTMLY
jgi:hypothetical protein